MLSLRWDECRCENTSTKVVKSQQKAKILWITLGLLVCFFFAEWSVGLWSKSLSLQADAGHMFSDITALLISLFA